MPFGNWVEETTVTTGTGTVTLVAVSNQTEFSDAFAVNDVVDYTLHLDNGDKEYGRGTVGTTKTLARTTVLATLISGVYDDSTATALTLSGTTTVRMSIGAASMMDKYNTEFEGALWRTGATLLGDAQETLVVLGTGNTAGKLGSSNGNILVGGTNCKSESPNSMCFGSNSNNLSLGSSFLFATNSNITATSATSSVIIGGFNNNLSSNQPGAIVAGSRNNVSGNWSATLGGEWGNISGNFSVALGGRGLKSTHVYCAISGGGGETRADFDFVVGGVATFTPNVANNTMRFAAATGDILIDGAVSSPEAGSGECVEWADGNPNNDDRTGLGVSIVNGKLYVGGADINGIISVSCGIVFNSAPNSWAGKYLKDNFKRKIFVEYETLEWVDEWGDEQNVYKLNDILYDEYQQPTAPAGRLSDKKPVGNITYGTQKVRAVNPNYDATKAADYISRVDRKEWGVVETDGQPLALAAEEITGEFVDFNAEGKVVNGTAYQVMAIDGDAIQIWFKGK